MLNKEDVIEACKKCLDPDLGIDLWTLGLIYDIKVVEDKVDITMTFTSPMCPYGPQLVADVETQVKEAGAKEVKVEVTFEPMWEPSEELKEMLGY